MSKTFTIDLRRLRVLRELRERGTIGATARTLHLTPSAVSQQIATLSREAGVPLLERHGRRVRLTPQAELLLEHAAIIHAQLEKVRGELAAYSEGTTGTVTIDAFGSAIAGLVAPALPAVYSARPRLRVRLSEVEAPECFSRLDAGECDLVVTVEYRGGPQRRDARYYRRYLLLDPLDVVIPGGHDLGKEDEVSLQDLAGEPWVIGGASGPCHEVPMAVCAAAGFNPDIRHCVNDWAAALALVGAGGGIALVPRLAIQSIALETVTIRPLGGALRPGRHIYAAVRNGSEHSPALAVVLDSLHAAARRYADHDGSNAGRPS